MSMKHTVFLNTGSQMLGKIISGAATFLTSILLAKTLGVEGYGDFTKIITYVAFFYLFCDIGLNAAYLQLAKGGTIKDMKNTLYSLRILLGILLMFTTIAILIFLPGSASRGYSSIVKFGVVLFAPSILFQALITTTNAVFQQHLRYDYVAIALISGSALTLFLVWLSTIIFSHSVMLFTFILATLAGILCTACISLWFAAKLAGSPTFSWKSSSVKKMLSIAAPLGVTLIFNVIYFHADTFILAITRSTSEVGVYGLAYKFFEFTLVIPTFFMNAVLPLFIQAYAANDHGLLYSQSKKSAIALFSASLLVSAVGIILTPLLTLIRPEFSESIAPLRLLLLSLPFFYLTNVTMWIMVVRKQHMHLMLIYGASMLINIGANLCFIPRYGYMAAAWVTVVSEFFILCASYIAVKQKNLLYSSYER